MLQQLRKFLPPLPTCWFDPLRCLVLSFRGMQMRRRDFIALGSAAVAWPVGVRAQALPVVGFLGSDSPELYTDRLRALRRGLKDAGFIESANVAIEYRWANGDNNR